MVEQAAADLVAALRGLGHRDRHRFTIVAAGLRDEHADLLGDDVDPPLAEVWATLAALSEAVSDQETATLRAMEAELLPVASIEPD